MTSNFLVFSANGDRFIQRGKNIGHALAKFAADNSGERIVAIIDQAFFEERCGTPQRKTARKGR